MRIAPLLAATVLLALALLAPAADGGKRDDSASEKLGIKLSMQCWTFHGQSFFETAEHAAKFGIRYLEMFNGQRLKPGADEKVGTGMSDTTIAEIKVKLAQLGGLRVIGCYVDPIPGDEAGARQVFEWAKKLGMEVLVTETRPTALLDKLANEYRIRVAIHNHPKTWPPDDVLAAVKDLSPMVGSCCDTGHWMRRNLVPAENFKKLEGRVMHSHFKDLDKFGDGHDVPWGTGKGDPKASLAELKRQGYKGYMSVEYEYGSIADLEVNVPKCVAFFDQTLAELVKAK